MTNPYKKEYKPNKSYSSKKMFKCKICKTGFSSSMVLNKHIHIHINPVYCQFPNCGKVFSPKHTYQYRQHMDGHNGGLNIKCKFCEHIAKSYSSNTLHMKAQHIKEYTLYMNTMKDLENNSSNTSYSEMNNLVLFADIALSYYCKINI